MPQVWSIPSRNPGFTERDRLLVAIREQLLDGDKAVVQALEGMGGVGKTQLAIEYAHQFAGTYDLAWWINSEQAGLIGEQFTALLRRTDGVRRGWAGTEACAWRCCANCAGTAGGCWCSTTPTPTLRT